MLYLETNDRMIYLITSSLQLILPSSFPFPHLIPKVKPLPFSLLRIRVTSSFPTLSFSSHEDAPPTYFQKISATPQLFLTTIISITFHSEGSLDNTSFLTIVNSSTIKDHMGNKIFEAKALQHVNFYSSFICLFDWGKESGNGIFAATMKPNSTNLLFQPHTAETTAAFPANTSFHMVWGSKYVCVVDGFHCVHQHPLSLYFQRVDAGPNHESETQIK